jgi:hypothetical protein
VNAWLVLLGLLVVVLFPMAVIATELAAITLLGILIARSAGYRPRLFTWRYW